MLVKIHRATRFALAVCDSDLFGKRFEEGKRQLDLTGKFFAGEEKKEEEVAEIIGFYQMEDACFNFVGKESCNLALKEGVVSQSDIDEINGIPFVLVLG